MRIENLRNQRDFYFTAHAIFIKPYLESKKYFSIAFSNYVQEPDIKAPISLGKKIISLLTGLVYCLPIINIIVYIAIQKLNTNQKKKELEIYFRQNPLNKIAEDNLKIFLEHLPSAIRASCNKYAEPTDKSVDCFLAELRFNSEGNLKNMLYGWSIWGERHRYVDCLRVYLNIKLTNKANENHNPFHFDPEKDICNHYNFNLEKDIDNKEELGLKKIQDIMQLMVDKLNNKHSKSAVIDFKNFEYNREELE